MRQIHEKEDKEICEIVMSERIEQDEFMRERNLDENSQKEVFLSPPSFSLSPQFFSLHLLWIIDELEIQNTNTFSSRHSDVCIRIW